MLLGSWAPGAAGDVAVRRYDLLPNYAAGWRRPSLEGGGELRIGSTEINRSADAGGGAHYRVTHDNATSGEQVVLDFRTTGDPLPRLTGPWSVTASQRRRRRAPWDRSRGGQPAWRLAGGW